MLGCGWCGLDWSAEDIDQLGPLVNMVMNLQVP
jgi:hypothetical protein